ncbi:uncharacterized protein LOC106658400 [Trichogramma pretiosum]|uniref:uncharacterized protein LOC106655008 n=1 Tax=Trichogramma pretiosum TaxID=7493 RepID=UPI0006C9A2A2|nr:uncharacterized protein LOC106655008 [Trichogramma pretiosum]XP_014235823.1 uncharacterized protein LOC106658400 [Trichogramma pretiosum]
MDFPLKTKEELLTFDKQLENDDFKRDMIDLLANTGGRDISALTINILSRVMVDEVATNFSFKGKYRKAPFSSLRLTECIMAAVMRTFPEATEIFIESKIGAWLVNAQFRQANREQKLKK